MAKDNGSDSMRMWGALLRCFRLAAGMTHDELAAYVGYSKSLVVGIERGLRMPSPMFAAKADEGLKADGWLVEMARHLSRERVPSWVEEYVDAEQRARSLWSYDAHVLHAVLRTEAYTRAVLAGCRPVLAEEDIEARVEAERQRQALWGRQPACTLSFIVEEWVLRRPIGGPAAMQGQLEHLAMLGGLRNVTLQVMPATHQSHAGLGGPMTLLETPAHTWLGYLEVQDVSHLINDPEQLSTLHDRYTSLRSHALTPDDSAALIRELRRELPTRTA